MNARNALAQRLLSYGIGNAGTKAIAYISILIYTFFISKEELGVYDVIMTTVTLIEPILSLRIQDAAYRWSIDSENSKDSHVIKTALCIIEFMLLLATVTAIIGNCFIKFNYFWIIIGYGTCYILYEFIHTILRGINSKLYALIGFLYAALYLIFEVSGFILGKFDLSILLISKMISSTICIFLIFVFAKDIREAVRDKFDYSLAKKMLKYSLPLVPNIIGWWIIDMSDRYIILGALGVAYNGVYSIANKIPNIMKVIGDTFQYAWQDTVLQEYSCNDGQALLTNVFNKYIKTIFSLCICAVPFTRVVVELFVGMEYKEAWQFTGLLYMAVILSSLGSLLGVGYAISKKTIKALKITYIPALINVIINLLLIKRIGLHAASLSTFVASLIRFILCYFDTRKILKIGIKWGQLIGLSLISIALSVILLYIENTLAVLLLFVCTLIFFMITNFNFIEEFYMRLIKRRRNVN